MSCAVFSGRKRCVILHWSNWRDAKCWRKSRRKQMDADIYLKERKMSPSSSTYFLYRHSSASVSSAVASRERKREKETERDRQTDRQTESQTETDRQTDRETETEERQRQTETDRQRQRQTETDRQRETDRQTETETEGQVRFGFIDMTFTVLSTLFYIA